MLEPLFRLGIVYTKKNDFNNFEIVINSINEICLFFVEKTNDSRNSCYYEFIATKICELFEIAIAENNQYFLEKIVLINQNISLKIIEEADIKYYNANDFFILSYFVDNCKNFVLYSLMLDHTSAPAVAIQTLDKIIQPLIRKEEFNYAKSIIDEIMFIANYIYKQQSTKKIGWFIHLLCSCELCLVNVFYLILYAAMYSTKDFNYLLKETKSKFLEIFAMLAKYSDFNSNPMCFISLFSGNEQLNIIYKLVDENPYIATIYTNLVYNSNAFLKIERINNIVDIFRFVAISDLSEKINFKRVFNLLNGFINIIYNAYEIIDKNSDSIHSAECLDSLVYVYNSILLFFKRTKACKFNFETSRYLCEMLIINILKEYNKIINNFTKINTYNIQNVLFSYVNILINVYNHIKQESDTLSLHDLFNESLKVLIALYEKTKIESNNVSIEIYSCIKLLCVAMYSINSKSIEFKNLFRFLQDNRFKIIVTDFYGDRYEENNLPYNTSQLISNITLNKYIRFEQKYNKIFLND